MDTLIIERKKGESDNDLMDRACMKLLDRRKYPKVEIRYNTRRRDTVTRAQAVRHLRIMLTSLEFFTSIEGLLKIFSTLISATRRKITKRERIKYLLEQERGA